jgi:hypothetical protein
MSMQGQARHLCMHHNSEVSEQRLRRARALTAPRLLRAERLRHVLARASGWRRERQRENGSTREQQVAAAAARHTWDDGAAPRRGAPALPCHHLSRLATPQILCNYARA